MPAIGFQRTLAFLARTPNHSASKVLEQGVKSGHPGVRDGAIAALARRKDFVSQRRLLALFHEFSPEEVTQLGDVSREVRSTVRTLLGRHDEDAIRDACHFIVACRAFDDFPALVTVASDPDHPGSDLAALATLELAHALHDEIAAYRQAPSGRDPSFARRWALTALAKAVERFESHRRSEILESFLLITTPGNHTLAQVLTEAEHPAHRPLLAMLRTSGSIGAIQLLAKLFDDTHTRTELLELATERTDAEFRSHFLRFLGYPVGRRVLENIRRVHRLPLLEQATGDWFELSGEQQATAVQLVAASRLSRRTKLSVIEALLQRAEPLARAAACEALGDLQLPEAVDRLKQLLSDPDAQVVAIAAKGLRRRGHTGAVRQLATLLEHTDSNVRNIARGGLRDFTFARYIDEFDSIDDAMRRDLGRIVRQTDESAAEQLTREIAAPVLVRKLRGLQMAVAMGMVDELVDVVITQVSHPDVEVRCAALDALANAEATAARDAVQRATEDESAQVRAKAAKIAPQSTDVPGTGPGKGGTR